jgi:hypothetical protein
VDVQCETLELISSLLFCPTVYTGNQIMDCTGGCSENFVLESYNLFMLEKNS